MIEPTSDDLQEILERYRLPDLPEDTTDDDTEARDLYLYRFQDETILLTRDAGVTLADAQAYCSDSDTHGGNSDDYTDAWFVGFDRR